MADIGISNISNLPEYHVLRHSIRNNSYIISWIKINGITYKKNVAFCLDINEYSEPQFGIIKYVATDFEHFYIIYDSCASILV